MMFMPAFFVVLFLMPWFIKMMRKLQIGEIVREEGPESHLSKSGTPTMGGLLVIASVLLCMLSALLLLKKPLFDGLWLLYLMSGYGLMGFADDYRKTIRKSPYGLKARESILLQTLIALPFLWAVWNTTISPYPLIFFILFELLVVLSVTNAVNLTDGLDGLLAGVALPIFIFYAVYGYFYAYPSLTLFALIFAGALAGFLFFNAWPAGIFMGNTGSFAIGGAIAGMAMVTGTEWFLLLLGAIFVLEALSVIIQVTWFKYTRIKRGEGRRIFRMAPIHHHFELKGYSEPLIAVRFWLLQAVLTVAAWFLLIRIK